MSMLRAVNECEVRLAEMRRVPGPLSVRDDCETVALRGGELESVGKGGW